MFLLQAWVLKALLLLESQGADKFFGEPANIFDLIQTEGGMGILNILAADRLRSHQSSPHSCFGFCWLYDQLPEVGDLPVPKPSSLMKLICFSPMPQGSDR